MSFFQFRHGYQHWVAALVGPQRPLGICIGAVVTSPLTVGSADTLFVMYGNIPDGAICLTRDRCLYEFLNEQHYLSG
jgi:hypothetical protein